MSNDPGKSVVHTVRNRAAADKQLTAEHILREAQEFVEVQSEASKRTFHDESEVETYKLEKRKEFQTTVAGKGKSQIGRYIQFALWEAKMNDFDASRRIFEDAITIDPTNVELWKKYAEMEISHQSIQAARNVYHRATKTLPCSTRLWLLWLELEERVENIDNARTIYYKMTHPEKGVIYNPPESIWQSYVNFEIRCQNYNGALRVYETYITKYPTPKTYIRYAFFVTKYGSKITEIPHHTINQEKVLNARVIYERAILELGLFSVLEQAKAYENMLYQQQQQQYGQNKPLISSGDSHHQQQQEQTIQKPPSELVDSTLELIFAWADYETAHEISHTRRILEHTLNIIPTTLEDKVLQKMLRIEKQHGDSDSIDIVLSRLNRLKYKQMLGLVYDPNHTTAKLASENNRDYDTWLEWAKVEEESAVYRARQWEKQAAIEKAKQSKKTIQLIVFELLSSGGDTSRSDTPSFHHDVREVYRLAQTYPPLPTAAQRALHPRSSPPLTVSIDKNDWKRFIYLFINHALYEELVAKDIDAARDVYKRCLQIIPHQYFTFSSIWIQYAKLEIRQGDIPRARSILGQGIGRIKDRIKAEQKRYGAPPQPILLSSSSSTTTTPQSQSRLQQKDPFTRPSNLKVLFEYVKLEQGLEAYDRCRTLLQSFIEVIPSSYDLWEQFTLFEANTGQLERARKLFHIALGLSDDDDADNKSTTALSSSQSVFIHETDEERFWVLYTEFAQALEDGSVIKAFEQWLTRQPDNINAYIKYSALIANHVKENLPIPPLAPAMTYTYDNGRSILQRYHTRIKHAIARSVDEERTLIQEMSNIALKINVLDPTQDTEAINLYAQDLYQLMQNTITVIEKTIKLRLNRRDILSKILLFEKTYGDQKSIEQATRNQPRKIQRTMQFLLPIDKNLLEIQGRANAAGMAGGGGAPMAPTGVTGSNSISFMDDTTVSILSLTNQWQITPHTFQDLLFPEDQKGISSLLDRARQKRQQQQQQQQQQQSESQSQSQQGSESNTNDDTQDNDDDTPTHPISKKINPVVQADHEDPSHPLNRYVQLGATHPENNGDQDLTPPELEQINS